MVLILPPVAALTLLVWNSFLTVDEEVQYIWTCVCNKSGSQETNIVFVYSSMRNGSPFKWVYFFLRYVVTVAQM